MQSPQNLNVDKSTVCRILQLFHTTRNVMKKEYPKVKCFLKTYVPSSAVHFTACFGMYWHEIQRELRDFLQVDVDVSTVYRHLHENGFTRQRLWYAAIQREELLRQQFILDAVVYAPKMLIFMDET